MTKKEMQMAENAVVETAMAEFDVGGYIPTLTPYTQLNQCQAGVLDWYGGKLLRSYNTIIAYIDTDGNCYDFLRKVYGYTTTSARQINKFARKYNAKRCYTWREV